MSRPNDPTRDALANALISIANTCKHEREERVEGGARWCIDCGAYMPKRGPVDIRHPSWKTLVHISEGLSAELAALADDPSKH